jgi:hypothetical protein
MGKNFKSKLFIFFLRRKHISPNLTSFSIPLLHLLSGITNMALAHEIAVDKDFTLQKLKSVDLTPPAPPPTPPALNNGDLRYGDLYCF